tara:strand:+ start:563 stop:736 length:174 start_codon:yes stop_codon:yes gene_type:complete
MKKYRVTLNVDDGWVENFNQVIEAEDEDEAATEALVQVKMNLTDYIDADVEEVNEKV